MSEDEAILLQDLSNQFWLDFSRMVHASLAKAPPHLRDELWAMLGDQSSVYGIADQGE